MSKHKAVIKLEDGTREEVDLADYLTRNDVVIRVIGQITYVIIKKDAE